MIKSKTLVSISMLMFKRDLNQDFIDYFIPFVIATLKDMDPKEPIYDSEVSSQLNKKCGIVVPSRPMQIILKRLSKKGVIEINDHRYTINATKLIQEPNIFDDSVSIQQKIQHFTNKFQQYYNLHENGSIDSDGAEKYIITFLEKFVIQSIQLSVKEEQESDRSKINEQIVGKFILDIQQNDQECFDYFVILLKGFIVANAITTNEYENTKSYYKNISFFLDTSLILNLCGLHDVYSQHSTIELINLVKKIGGKFFVFSKTIEEATASIDFAISHLRSHSNTLGNRIVRFAKEQNKGPSELELKREKLEDSLKGYGISIFPDPSFVIQYNVDEICLKNLLSSHINYQRDNALIHDIRVIQNIYFLRKGYSAKRIEDSIAIFVSDNTEFVKAAQEFSKKNQLGFTTATTSFHLANQAWLKDPLSTSSLPQNELLAVAYASQKPSNDFLRNYLKKINSLKEEKNLNDDDYFILTSIVTDEDVMDATKGDISLLTKDSLSEIVLRTRKRIAAEEYNKQIKKEARIIRVFCIWALRILSVLFSATLFYYSENSIIKFAMDVIAWIATLLGFALIKWFDKIGIYIETAIINYRSK